MSYMEEYKRKSVSAAEAVKVVKSGDWVEYSQFACAPPVLDEALSLRKDELIGVKIRAVTTLFPPKVCVVDPEGKHFVYNSWHMSGAERKMHDKGLCTYVPFTYTRGPEIYDRYLNPDVAMMQVSSMDKHGYFNFGTSCSFAYAQCKNAKKVIVEVNDQMPVCFGGSGEGIHISEVDYIVEGISKPLLQIPNPVITDIDNKIAGLVMEEMEDGACLQLGIGGMPNAVGKMIAESDLKDLGVHTEMLADSYVDMYEAGRITGACKTTDRYKMVYTFAMGTSKLYDFMDKNPMLATYPVSYTNSPFVIAQNDKVTCINNAVEVDLYGQVASESSGTRHISGTGGQLDFIFASWYSKGGKGFICLTSTFKDKEGNLKSRIVPYLAPGTIITVPRSVTFYVITEHGICNLKGTSNWERAEALIKIAHPDLQDELVKDAQKMNIWKTTNKLRD
ncbi:MAG: acetyl-CoA hydrolase/transferase C-terminal domain-containing protein [Syntrophomonas sp.]|nr:acetyl-CoA hydrolase/transferase C-terminal domain-containing protein [Syntrophomonas sp.]